MATTFFAQTVTTFTEGTPDDGIAIDSNGNIYCSNYVGDTVFKFTPSGDVSSFITGLNTPNGLAFNSNEELYVCDGQGNTIFKYDINGNLLDSYPTVSHPTGIVKDFDSEDMIFTEYQGNIINRLSTDGIITPVSSAVGLNGPVGLAFDENGVLYVGNYTDRDIYRVLENGTIEYIATVPTDGGYLPNLGFIAYGQGYLWGTTMGSDKIYKINPNDVADYEIFAGSTQGSLDGDISVATFHTPNGIAFNDAEDTMYITDFTTKNLRIISGIVLANDEFSSKKSEVEIYPNPSEEQLNIQFFTSENYTIRVYDSLGKEMFLLTNHSFEEKVIETIDVSSWSKGIYFVEVKSENNSETKKFIR